MVVLWPDGTALHSTPGVDSRTACLQDEQILMHWEKSRFGPAYAQEAEDDEDDEVESLSVFVYICSFCFCILAVLGALSFCFV
eukprot:COSAG05_NODE_2215_length_3380_cov_6.954282_2_plen_83_part_00